MSSPAQGRDGRPDRGRAEGARRDEPRGARWRSARARRTRRPRRKPPGWDRRPPGGRNRCARSAPNLAESSLFRLLGRTGTSAGSTPSSPSSGGGTIRKQVRTASASALFVACHTASRPASCTHSSSSHPSREPSGEPRARSQASTTVALAPRLRGLRRRGRDQVPGKSVRHGPHQRAEDLVAGFGSRLDRTASSVFDSGTRTAVNEAGRAHASASIRPRS